MARDELVLRPAPLEDRFRSSPPGARQGELRAKSPISIGSCVRLATSIVQSRTRPSVRKVCAAFSTVPSTSFVKTVASGDGAVFTGSF